LHVLLRDELAGLGLSSEWPSLGKAKRGGEICERRQLVSIYFCALRPKRLIGMKDSRKVVQLARIGCWGGTPTGSHCRPNLDFEQLADVRLRASSLRGRKQCRPFPGGILAFLPLARRAIGPIPGGTSFTVELATVSAPEVAW